jgi:hypothetical protein
MTQYRYEYGKRWNAELPRNSISSLIARTHVGKSDEEIADMIKARCKQSDIPARLIAQCVRYALLCQAENRDLYRRVMSGRL